LDIALRAFKEAVPNIPQAEFHLYGDGNAKSELMQLAKDLGLNGSVKFFEPLPVRDVAKVMADADIGVVPKRADSFGDEAYSTKIMEFMSLGVPVIVSSTKIDRYYFNDSVVRFFKSGEVQALAEAMVEMSRKPEMRQEMAARAFEYARENSWEKRKADYLDLVDNVCGSDR
jgi:glycosyltransferase involved in cell wall biosynthesis